MYDSSNLGTAFPSISSRARKTPLDRRTDMSVADVVAIAGNDERTVRYWCEKYGIGRRAVEGAGSSRWVICRPLLHAFMEGADGKDQVRRYLEGEAPGELLRQHYERLGVLDLL